MASSVSGTIQLSDKTHKVPLTLHAKNRQRTCERLRQKTGVPAGSVVLLQGGEDLNLYNTDIEYVFRQEPFFKWAFGVEEPNCYGLIDLNSGKSTLFFPRLPETYAIWMGKIHGLDHFQKKYGVEATAYADELGSVVRSINPSKILVLHGKNTDSNLVIKPPELNGIKEAYNVDDKILYDELVELRVIKTPEEIDLMRYCAEVSSEAHKVMIKAVKPGLHEYQLESVFQHHVYYHGGMRHMAYTSICACGPNSTVLHYGHAGAPNSGEMVDGGLFLADLGGEYHGYTSDITTTVPVNGKFTDKQKVVYNAALDANRQVLAACRPGVEWADMHRLADRVIVQHLKAAGVLVGDVDEMVRERVGAVFFPHGLGHLIGLDTHDVGGYPPGTDRIDEPGLRSLRMNRKLQANMVVTIEPGCYFNDYSLDKALADPRLSRYLVRGKIEEYRGVGGVRIEDDVWITDTGAQNLTKVPRTVEEIEKFMAQK